MYKIEEHDYQVRINQADFLKDDKVKATVMFRGREIQHSDLGDSAQADGNGSTGSWEVQHTEKKEKI